MIPTSCQSICSECGKPLSELWRSAGGCPYCGTLISGTIGSRSFMFDRTRYGPSYSGKGWVVVPLGVALPILSMYLFIAYLYYNCFSLPDAMYIPAGSGWVVAGAACWIIGRIGNRDRAFHRFLGFRVECWGLFYFIPGLLILLPTLLPDVLPITTREPGALHVVSAVIIGLAAMACVLLQLVTALLGLAFLLVRVPAYVVHLVVSLKTRPNQPTIQDSP
jgi:hypothetical protein